MKPAHHRGTFHRRAAQVRKQANANPSTRCWRCGKTMAQVRVAHPEAKWQAGHLVDGQVDGPLAAECSPCNLAAGGRLRVERARGRLRGGRRTDLTW